ncbi:DUF5682 family protein [Streptomyces sp. NBC_00264]|uniref:DUF5682 family protein n=1 Tax=unclassified Streptomyces TaxID=2593676 RepID=UPI00224E62A8|nr:MULTISPECIES: DUF5682 family protein [unclassified Streptomyces]MCX5162406.1 DUF5682 family protein [Streptomyces sp. NBC_00305]MCX5220923.1 DUF5682 family protein [Streptomyces sp. NBC_00264]
MTRAETTQDEMTRAERPAGPLLLGVRHHGPGSARAVRAALDAARPQAVLVEGPPEADALLPLAADERMRPPVALLAHAVDDPGQAAFWPLASFSPEWIAIRWALEHGVPVRFIDLPAANSLAMTQGNGEGHEDGGAEEDEGADGEEGAEGPAARAPIDPIGVLARTAGYDDPERWWEDVVEHRTRDGEVVDPRAPFAALAEAMTALREVYGDGGHPRDAVREAHMRIQLRKAVKEFGDDIAVVCGAWHVPALGTRTTLTADRALLKGLPKVKAELTWVPWSHRRLARHSGYGAGIDSPGWYGHLFDAPDRPIERWMTKVAGLMRDEDRFVSSAHVIEAVRLAETLAAMRGRPLAGLGETMDAIRAVMCEGSDVPLALVQDRLIVGEALGEVPDTAPAVPLQRDLTRQQRTLRLKPEAQERELELDLRKDNDAARSRLLHRLRILAVGWGEPAAGRASTGTFRESWRLRWEPELYVQVAEAGTWGTTVLSAATAKAGAQAASATALAEVTALAEQCLLAELPDALPVVMRALADRAALDSDVGRLADALPALARTLRYGDVRSTDTAALAGVAAGLAERICVGLPPACTGLDADGAAELRGRVDAVHTAIGLLTGAAPANPGPATDTSTETGTDADTETGTDADTETGTDADTETGTGAGAGMDADTSKNANANADTDTSTNANADTDTDADADTGTGTGTNADTGGLRGRWTAVLHKLAARDTVAGVVRGRATRLLLDEGRLAEDDAARLMGLALSPGTPPADAAEWIEGFVGGAAGGGMLLVHDERLLGLVDAWLTGVPADRFADVLPLLRRTFSAYEAGVRRTLGELVRRGPSAGGPAATGTGAGAAAPAPGFGPALDEARADAVEPVLRLLLGLHNDPGPDGDARSGRAGRAANVEEPLGATG